LQYASQNHRFSNTLRLPHAMAFLQAVISKEYLFTHHMVKFLPHMKARHPLYPLLVLRATCRRMIKPCIIAMAQRSVFLRFHRQIVLSEQQSTQNFRMRDSGFLCQAWLPRPWHTWRNELQKKGLLFDGHTDRPMGMTQQYWNKLWERCGKCGTSIGWVDGKLML
jgi:hypothetical protein